MPETAFAAYPRQILRDEAGKPVRELLWGDFVSVLGVAGDKLKVRSRGSDGFLAPAQIQDSRLLEVNFVDIGQGDGAFLVMPDDRKMVIDAGEADNMFRFLSWRFNLRANPDREVKIDDVVISHPDMDHYKGFTPIFGSEQFAFGTVYHNGIVEQIGANTTLGTKTGKFLTSVVADRTALRQITTDPARTGSKLYPNLLKKLDESGRSGDIRMISASDGFLPGYEADKEVSIRVLGPVLSPSGGQPAYKWFEDPGKTKNGHSVVLRLTIGSVSILLGGDLNIPAERHLLEHYTGLGIEASNEETLVQAARQTFQADIAKACHHGSADFSTSYLRAVNALATVISSGDAESHAHPRPDALGAFGKYSRGVRPLIFSNELARSSKDKIKHPQALRDEIQKLQAKIDVADGAEKAALQEKFTKLLVTIERSVSVYGMITLRTDGTKVLMAQRLEERRVGPSSVADFDTYQLEPDHNGVLQYTSKHEE